jgi:hypothetical protein
MRCMLSALAVIAACWVAGPVASAQSLGGGAFIPVQDGSNHDCIDVTRSLVSISLVTAQIKRTNTFWATSKSLGVKIDLKLLNQASQAFDFPRGRQLSVSSYKGDIGLLPMVFPVMAKYPLVDATDKKAYVNVGLDVFLINIEGETSSAKAVLSFIDFSKNLPLPANPYSQGVQLFGEFAQKIIDANIQSAADRLPAATLSFDLASSSDDVAHCEQQRDAAWRYPTLRDGIVAVMWDYEGRPEDGFVRVSDVDQYCFYPTPARRIAFAAKINNACPPAAQARMLNNPLVAFAIDKWSLQPSTLTPSDFKVGPLEGAVAKPALSFPSAEAVVHQQANTLAYVQGTPDSARFMNPTGLKAYFDAINAGTLDQQFSAASRESGPKAANVREAETAIALHRCGLLGIPAHDCL